MKMYKAYFYYSAELSEVEIEKKTEKSVWVCGSRRAMSCEYESYHDSFESAKEWLTIKAQGKVGRARLVLERAKAALDNVKGMKP